jgi:hypothetical protein
MLNNVVKEKFNKINFLKNEYFKRIGDKNLISLDLRWGEILLKF